MIEEPPSGGFFILDLLHLSNSAAGGESKFVLLLNPHDQVIL